MALLYTHYAISGANIFESFCTTSILPKTEELTQIQLKHIFNIISILAKYMLLTTDMLMELYQRTYHEKMGLSYLKRAVKEKLIIEYQYDLDEVSEKKEYYYALKGSTYNYLKQNRIAFLKLPPQAAYEEKSRILTCNKYIIEHGYQPNISMVLDSNLQYFFTIQNVICYFHNLITPQDVKAASWCPAVDVVNCPYIDGTSVQT